MCVCVRTAGKPLRLLIAIQPGYHFEFGAKTVCAAMADSSSAVLALDDWAVDYPYYERHFGPRLQHSLYVADATAEGAPVVVAVQTFVELEQPRTARVLCMDERGARRLIMHGE